MNYALVVISRNRPGFLARLLSYYRQQGLRARIHLGDASSGEDRERVAGLVAEFQGDLDIVFTAYDGSLSVMERLRRQFDQVEAPYAAWVGDDDFLVPSALEAGAALMDARPACAAVIGKAVAFSVAADAVRGAVTTVADYLQLPLPQASPVDRLLAQSRQGAAFTYSLRRTALTQRFMADLNPGFWPDDVFGYYFFEILDGFLTAAAGTVERIDRLMMARQVHLASSNAAGWMRTNAFRMVTDPRWPGFIAQVSGVIDAALRAADPALTPEEAARATELALWNRVNMALAKGLKREWGLRGGTVGKAGRMKAAVKSMLPRASRQAALLRQRASLPAGEFAHLGGIVNAIESELHQGCPAGASGGRP